MKKIPVFLLAFLVLIAVTGCSGGVNTDKKQKMKKRTTL
jgi:hypothetical protein